ncbi:MAG: hypothetical protein ACXABY_08130, partial [Candidatus Thorarchaeota archaeon]|jgi:hypothetical protein
VDVVLTLGVALARALQQGDEKVPGEERIKRSIMAIEIVKAEEAGVEVEWDSNKVAMAKELTLKVWTNPIVYYRIDQLMEGK